MRKLREEDARRMSAVLEAELIPISQPFVSLIVSAPDTDKLEKAAQATLGMKWGRGELLMLDRSACYRRFNPCDFVRGTDCPLAECAAARATGVATTGRTVFAAASGLVVAVTTQHYTTIHAA
jgi:hypothetical protein